MKKMNFKWLVVLCMAIGFVNVVKAQIYSNEECYYIEAGANNPKNGGPDVFVQVVSFDGSSLVHSQGWYSSIKRELKKGENVLKQQLDYYQNKMGYRYSNQYNVCQHIRTYLYNSNMSTSMREVYKSVSSSQWGSTIVCYIAIANDKSSIIMWEGDNVDRKKTYIRIDKDDLLPEAVNYDFLNE